MSEENALIALATDPVKILGDGIREDLPIFNVDIMKGLAEQELAKLKTLPKVDLTTEKGRKIVRAAVKPVKQMFDDFEKNIKVVKKSTSDIPKKCDAVSLAMRKMSAEAFEKATAEVDEIDEAKAEVTKWFNTLQNKDKDIAPIPANSKYELENGLQTLKDKQPHRYFNEAEIADFWEQKNAYIAAWEKALNWIYAEEKAKREAEEKRIAEDKRLREESERLAAEAKKQREAQAAIEAEQRRLAQEQAELERQKQQAQQAAVNPAPPDEALTLKTQGGGAPPAITEEAKRAMRKKAVELMAGFVAGQYAKERALDQPIDPYGIAEFICKTIYANKIPHVRFCYENN